MRFINTSITRRILFYLIIVATVLIVAIFFTFEEAGKNAFKKMEEEKAEVKLHRYAEEKS